MHVMDANVLHVNLDNVLYMCGGTNGTRLFMIGRSEDDSIMVRETPEQIMKAAIP
jgi:hypothetical protein